MVRLGEGEASVTTLYDDTGVSMQGLYGILKLLIDQHIVTREGTGKKTIYRITPTGTKYVMKLLRKTEPQNA